MLGCELLESRETPAGITLDGGVLTIAAGDGGAYVTTWESAWDASGNATQISVGHNLGDGSPYRVDTFAGVNEVVIVGGAGNDFLANGTRADARVYGGAGNDTLHSGYGDYSLVDGGSGNDWVRVFSDTADVYGGSGSDVLLIYSGWVQNALLHDVGAGDQVYGGNYTLAPH